MWKSAEDKKKRAEIFKDTSAFFKENKTLSDAIEKSILETRFYAENDYPNLPDAEKKAGKIEISSERSFESAIRLQKENPGKKIAVLNFASAVNPGGGVVSGSGAQEECLCRTSTLYPALKCSSNQANYYGPNKLSGNNLHTDACIYTPGVIICKTDTAFPERVSEEEFVTVDVISCAAPNLNLRDTRRYSGDQAFVGELSEEELFGLHYKRCKHILAVAAANEADIVVLGAFGCGAFKNNPETVAQAMAKASNEYSKYFEIVNFAIKKGRGEDSNDKVFARFIK